MNPVIKRIYDPYNPTDGYRVLVDRLWPRDISKDEAKLSDWAKEIAPSSELRTWFGHIPDRFEEFQLKYYEELRVNELAACKLDQLCEMAKERRVTLLYAAKDPIYNHAQVVRQEMIRRLEM